MSDEYIFRRKTIAPDISLFEMIGEPSMEQWLDSMRQATEWMQDHESRGKRWGIIIDPTGMPSLSAAMRKTAGEWRARNMPLIANTCICGSYVAESAWLRGAVTAVMWFARPAIPVKIHPTQEAALLWTEQQLNQHGQG